MGQKRGRDTSDCGTARGVVLGRLLRPSVLVGSGHRGDEVPGFFKVRFLDQDLELGQAVDREGIDPRGHPAADDGHDAVAFEEVFDQVRFERAVDAGELDEVGVIVLRRSAVVIFRHGEKPFLDAR